MENVAIIIMACSSLLCCYELLGKQASAYVHITVCAKVLVQFSWTLNMAAIVLDDRSLCMYSETCVGSDFYATPIGLNLHCADGAGA